MDPAIQTVNAVPSLDEIARDPARAGHLGRPALTALLLRTAAAQSAIVAQLTAIGSMEQPARSGEADGKMLTVDEAAARLRKSRQWIYRHAKTLPFVRRLSRKSLLVSEADLKRYLDRRKAV
jgi:excisionase family DNA binding protein